MEVMKEKSAACRLIILDGFIRKCRALITNLIVKGQTKWIQKGMKTCMGIWLLLGNCKGEESLIIKGEKGRQHLKGSN